MTVHITTHPATTPTSGPDRRIKLTEAQWHDFSRSVMTGNNVPTTTVEVQPFVPGDSRQGAVVMLCMFISEGINNLSGQADIMLSPDEARAVARILIVAAEEAGALDEADRMALTGVSA